MYEKLKAVITDSGFWNGEQKKSHAFLLSPSVYEITPAQREQLSLLGVALYDCLLGLSHIAVIAYDSNLNYGGRWLMARRIHTARTAAIRQSRNSVTEQWLTAARELPRTVFNALAAGGLHETAGGGGGAIRYGSSRSDRLSCACS